MTKQDNFAFSFEFLHAFFGKLGAEDFITFFSKSFSPPTNFYDLRELITPQIDNKKMVLIDGHPRTGKTWLAISLISNLIYENKDISYWTSGKDSQNIDHGQYYPLLSALSKVSEQITTFLSNKPFKDNSRFIFLLDDIFGTNTPRPFGCDFFDDKIKEFLFFDKKNKLLDLLPNNSTLVITSRSLFVFLIQQLFEIEYRPKCIPISAESKTIYEFNRIRWGIFRKYEDFQVEVSFSKPNIEDLINKNLENHPLKNRKNKTYLYLNAPIVAFAERYKRNITSSHEELEAIRKIKNAASFVFFQEDLDSLFSVTFGIDRYYPLDKRNIRINEATRNLRRAYLTAISPAFIFLGGEAYNILGFDKGFCDDIIEAMYYSDKKIKSTRVPNEFYMYALNRHLEGKVESVLILVEEFVSSIKDEKKQCTTIGVFLRSIIERALHKKIPGNLSELFVLPIFKKLCEQYRRIYKKNNNESDEDYLIIYEIMNAWENNYEPILDFHPKELNIPVLQLTPGLISTFAWLLTISKVHKGNNEITEWFDDTLRQVYSSNKTARIKFDLITAIYSTFLQWILKNTDADEKIFSINSVKNMAKIAYEFEVYFSLNELENQESYFSLKESLITIIEDELIWAIVNHDNNTLRYIDLKDVSEIDNFINSLTNYNTPDSKKEQIIFTNRFFSLVWHNDWMDEDIENKSVDKILSDNARKWIDNTFQAVLNLIKSDSELIDINLRYHWNHFITQRSTWMRDWCFEEDPVLFEYESNQIAEGSENKIHLIYFISIVNQLLQDILINMKCDDSSSQSSDRLKYLMIFIGPRSNVKMEINDEYFIKYRIQEDKKDIIRTTYIEITEQWDELKNKLDQIITDAIKFDKQEYIEAILIGIFELSRQGLLEQYSERTSLRFRKWCGTTLKLIKEKDEDIFKRSWEHYYKELTFFSYHLDLLPDRENGWETIIPHLFEEN